MKKDFLLFLVVAIALPLLSGCAEEMSIYRKGGDNLFHSSGSVVLDSKEHSTPLMICERIAKIEVWASTDPTPVSRNISRKEKHFKIDRDWFSIEYESGDISMIYVNLEQNSSGEPRFLFVQVSGPSGTDVVDIEQSAD